LTTPPSCPGCSTVAAYTVDSQLSIKYRLNSLIDRASDQGVLAHLRIIAHLAASLNAWTGRPLKAAETQAPVVASHAALHRTQG